MLDVANNFPWYDGYWLRRYYAAREYLARNRPDKLAEFVATIDRLRTRLDFQPVEVKSFLDPDTLQEAREVVRSIPQGQLELHEMHSFGRFIVHNHAWFTDLQQRLASRVAELVGEEVEPRYNFLSMYTHLGVCPLHMDGPDAKWTIDICLDQSYEWPIHFGPIGTWPTPDQQYGPDWRGEVLANTPFTSFTLQPGDALVFSGSAQFHYRDTIRRENKRDFCNLLFLHYVPKGLIPASKTENWAELFDEPAISFEDS